MENLIKLQFAAKEAMEKFMRNYKKDSKERQVKPYYEKRLKTFSQYWEAFCKRDSEIILLRTVENEKNNYFTEEIYASVEDFYLRCYSEIENDFLLKYGDNGLNDNRFEENKNVEISQKGNENVKLPRISLPSFNGNYSEWITFYDLFKTLVHENKSLSPAQKLQYLKANLIGEAQHLLSSFTISDANYLSAWTMLKDRYHNKRVLVKKQLEILFSQPNLSSESCQGIKGLLDKTAECLAALENLEVSVVDWDPILIHIVVQKFPYETHELWEQSISTRQDLPTWKELKDFLMARFRTLEAIDKKKPHLKELGTKPWRKPQSFVVNTSTCILCSEPHSIRRCPKYLQLNQEDRLKTVKSRGLCVNCLGTGHLATCCPSKERCFKCHQNHHSTLHRRRISASYNHNQPTEERPGNKNYSSDNIRLENGIPLFRGSTSERFQSTHPPEPLPSTSRVNTFFVNNKPSFEPVLLATALVIVVSQEGLKQTCRALIDPGSQASFITERVVQVLRLKKHSAQTQITGVASVNAGNVRYQTTFNLESSLNNEVVVEATAFVLSKITNPLPNTDLKNYNWKHLEGISLADPS